MSDKPPRKDAAKKPAGKTLKEKRAAKKNKKTEKPATFITPGH